MDNRSHLPGEKGEWVSTKAVDAGLCQRQAASHDYIAYHGQASSPGVVSPRCRALFQRGARESVDLVAWRRLFVVRAADLKRQIAHRSAGHRRKHTVAVLLSSVASGNADTGLKAVRSATNFISI